MLCLIMGKRSYEDAGCWHETAPSMQVCECRGRLVSAVHGFDELIRSSRSFHFTTRTVFTRDSLLCVRPTCLPWNELQT